MCVRVYVCAGSDPGWGPGGPEPNFFCKKMNESGKS